MPVEFHQEMQQQNQEQFRIPYDTRPLEGDLKPSEKIAMHGGIVIVNATNVHVLVRVEFHLSTGYRLFIHDPETGLLLITAQSPMNTAYLFYPAEQGYGLEPLDVEEPN